MTLTGTLHIEPDLEVSLRKSFLDDSPWRLQEWINNTLCQAALAIHPTIDSGSIFCRWEETKESEYD